MGKIRQFWEKGKWKQLKKSDWIVIALVGVLLMIIALPLDGNPEEETPGSGLETNTIQIEGKVEAAVSEEAEDTYTADLEQKLEKVLTQMEGVGKVEVMITVSDKGEHVVEKDRTGTATTTAETDSAGGARTVTENNQGETTVYVESGDETHPYVQKEKLPEVIGVIVVAEGGGNSRVVSDISDAVKALFPVEAHRIKVVKMCSKEE